MQIWNSIRRTHYSRHVHSPEQVPGVVGVVYHETIGVNPFISMSREKRRLGLRQSGSPITSIPTLRDVGNSV